MKKVKVMLASVAVLAVIGGAFAFKAKTEFGTSVRTSTTISPANGCTIVTPNVTTTTAATLTSVYYTTAATGECAPAKVFLTAHN